MSTETAFDPQCSYPSWPAALPERCPFCNDGIHSDFWGHRWFGKYSCGLVIERNASTGYPIQIHAACPKLKPEETAPAAVKGWQLPDPPAGREWHQTDEFTEEMWREGWRPMMVGETGEYEYFHYTRQWTTGTQVDTPCEERGVQRRVRRSIPQSEPPQADADPFADLKAAHAAGKAIQGKWGMNGEWKDIPDPAWNMTFDRYRIKPPVNEPAKEVALPEYAPDFCSECGAGMYAATKKFWNVESYVCGRILERKDKSEPFNETALCRRKATSAPGKAPESGTLAVLPASQPKPLSKPTDALLDKICEAVLVRQTNPDPDVTFTSMNSLDREGLNYRFRGTVDHNGFTYNFDIESGNWNGTVVHDWEVESNPAPPPAAVEPKPKTREDYLRELPDGYRELALSRPVSHCEVTANSPVTDMATALYTLQWADSPEGFTWWNGLRNHYCVGTPLPPLPDQPKPKPSEHERLFREAQAAHAAMLSTPSPKIEPETQTKTPSTMATTATCIPASNRADCGVISTVSVFDQPPIGSTWMLDGYKAKVVASSPEGVAVEGKKTRAQYSTDRWRQVCHNGSAIRVVTRRERRSADKFARQFTNEPAASPCTLPGDLGRAMRYYGTRWTRAKRFARTMLLGVGLTLSQTPVGKATTSAGWNAAKTFITSLLG